MRRDVVILGAGGFAREVLDVFEACNDREETYNVLGFVVDSRFGLPGTSINDKEILGNLGWLAERAREVEVICAVGAPEIRRSLVARAEAVGCRFCSVVHPNAVLTRRIELGPGTVVTAGCILTNNIRLGPHVHLNLDCTVGHDSVLEGFATIAPGVHVSGNVRIGTGAYVGTGANILEKITIGAWSVVGAGSTVIRDIPRGATAVGSPAKVIKESVEGLQLGG
ncbi:MAG: acetyltransferase [Acidobacteriota bacterium]|nr:acetyltransferase [Acidobacteriota bacterium]